MSTGRHYDYPAPLVTRIKGAFPDHPALHQALEEGDSRAQYLLSDTTPPDQNNERAILVRELFQFTENADCRDKTQSL